MQCDTTETPIFGLQVQQLWPIVERIAGATVAELEIAIEQQVQGFPGWAGEKLVPTLSYRTISDKSEQITVFVKRLRPGTREALHYRYLAEHGIRVAHLYGMVYGTQGEEILFLEKLDRVFNGIEERYLEVRQTFLHELAHFHCLKLEEVYAAQLEHKDIGRELREGEAKEVLERIWQHAARGELGRKLEALCWEQRDKVVTLAKYARVLGERVGEMPYGITNGEFGIGSRPDSDEWRLFDLHSIALRPRFYDLIYILGQPPHMQSVYGAAWQPSEVWGQLYLEEWQRYTEQEVSLQELLDETYTLWLAQTCMLNMWLELSLTGDVIWTQNRRVARKHCRYHLYQQLAYLLDVVV